MAVVIASSLRKEIAGNLLFDGVSFKVERGERLALAGPNGAGKTTLLRILAGDTESHGGELAFSKGTRVALHDQRPPLPASVSTSTARPVDSDGSRAKPAILEAGIASDALERAQTMREYALSAAADLLHVERELGRLEDAMAGGDHAPETLRRYGEARARLDHAGGYAWRERVDAVLRGVGFSDDDLDRPLTTFSGGELTRASLARTLAGDPDLLLLDEPTNHLDVASLEWLERELQSLDAGVILVAHDRWFLEAVSTGVLELEAGRSTYFAGPWHAWRREKAARLQAATKASERIGRDIDRLERFVARFRASTEKMARQAQVKLTQIERLQRERAQATNQIELLTRRGKRLGFDFLQPVRSGRTVLEVDGLEIAAGDKPLLADASFALERGEHVALIGPNGSGKTTLLETVLGRLQPRAGRIRLGHGVQAAYFSQHEVELDTRGSVLDCAQRATGLTRPEAQSLLGRFLFSGWEAQGTPVTALSGGERRRLALALVVASGANFLVLDEPTNHLDLESREALEEALEAFPGTVLLVSHDRAMLDAVASRILAVEGEGLRSTEGGWAEYVRRRDERAAAAQREANRPKRKAKPAKTAASTQPSELELIEREVFAREQEVAELERRLAADWTDADTASAHRRAREELQRALSRWEKLFADSQA
jgi:ATP-binding cassette, subfamily F, member 3